MSLFNFPSNQERAEGPSRMERTVHNLQEQIAEIRANGSGGIVGFTTESKKLSVNTTEISVMGVTETKNIVGLGRMELRLISDQLNAYLAADARPFVVSVHETKSITPQSPDDDFIQNSFFMLRVTAQE